MASLSGASPDTHDEDEEDDYEENGGSRLLGFMFGNVDDSGDLDVDYLDEDAKEHIAALADDLGSSLKDIDLSTKSALPTDVSEHDYEEKALDAVDYEDIEEQYEGPEIEVPSEEEHLLPKKEYFSYKVSVADLDQKASIYDEEDYDEDEDVAKETDLVNIAAEKADYPLAGDSVHLPTNESLNGDLSKDHVTDHNVLKAQTSDDDSHLHGSAENMSVNNDYAEEENASLFDSRGERKEKSLPILYEDNGIVILRFSEIFGIHDPPKKSVNVGNHHISLLKERFRIANLGATVEEDEELFLKTSVQNLPVHTSSTLTKEIELLTVDSDEEGGGFGTSSSYASNFKKGYFLPAQPMKESTDMDVSVSWQFSSYNEFCPLDHEDWEHEIIWDDSSSRSFEACEYQFAVDSADFEHHANYKDEMIVGNQDVESAFHGKMDGKYGSSLSSSSSAPLTSVSELLDWSFHPQLLRLEANLSLKNLVADHANENEVVLSEELVGVAVKRLNRLSLRNKEILDGSWMDKIVWDSAEQRSKPKLILDLQDDKMVFEIFDNNLDSSHIRSHASAMIITRSSNIGYGDSSETPVLGSSGRFNISNDKPYSNRKISQSAKSNSKKRAAHGIKILHSVPALKLQTMKPKLSNKEISNFHRPKAVWYPHDNEVAAKKQGKLVPQGRMKIIVKSMGGKGSKLHVTADEMLTSVKVKASKKLDYKNTEKVKIFFSGKELEDNQTLFMQNVRPNSVLHLVRSTIHLWPRAQKLPGENRPLRPPGAFKKKSELSVKDGHVFLMEYCEERPLLLGNVGMGARFCTYYQKTGSNDQTGFSLKNEKGLGNVIALDSTDKSPFIGDIRPGYRQSSLETNMYRAPVFPQKTHSTDYLLVRSSKGKLSLRRIDRVFTVGQQEPHVEVMPPGSKNVPTYLVNRLLVYIYREFRAKEKAGILPSVQVEELSSQFPGISEAILRKRLKQFADLQRGRGGHLIWVKRKNFRIPSEEELRRLVTPENVCAYESMQAGLHRLKRLGISRLINTVTTNVSFAMNQLPDEAITLAAASHIERELLITSWSLTSNFLSCTNQDRENFDRMEITGVGDPSGRGLGVSYVRVATKPPVATSTMKKKAAAARGSAAVTGTDADLRRLSMDAAREVLVKFKVPEEQIEKMTRWHRIAMVRKLSSEQATSGVQVHSTTLSKFARGHRMSYLQVQQQAREKCQEIWDRQAQSLSAVEGDENDSDSEANSDLDSFAGDLENLLDAEECEEWDGDIESRGGKTDGVRGLKIRRAPWQSQTQEEMEDEAAEAAELWRMLIDDDEMDKNNKKIKAKPAIEHLTVNNSKGEVSFQRPISGPKLKNSNNDFLRSGLLKLKNQTDDDVFELMREKRNFDRPVRENFICGACGQQGHMRTNKNCPKYGEEIESILKITEPETPRPPLRLMAELPSSRQFESSSVKKLKITPAETSESSEQLGPKKALPLKLKCPSEKSLDRYISDTETGTKPAVKINKIILSNKVQSENDQSDLPKTILFAKRPLDVSESDPPRKKLIIKHSKTSNDVDEARNSIGFGIDDNFKKTKRMVELSGFDSYEKQDVRFSGQGLGAYTGVSEDRRFWEMEEKRRKNRLEEEKVKRMYEEERMKQQRHIEFLRYEEALVNGREWAAKEKKKKKKKKKMITDDYLDELESKNRTAKRRTFTDLGHTSAEFGTYPKRRRGGEVALSNILETIVEELKEKRALSYLFLKPVTKKEAPDYLDIIDTPMDLSTIRDKVRKMEYRNRREFQQDVCQISENAHRYNDRINPGIPPLADQLVRFCDHLLQENKRLLDDAESGIEQWG